MIDQLAVSTSIEKVETGSSAVTLSGFASASEKRSVLASGAIRKSRSGRESCWVAAKAPVLAAAAGSIAGSAENAMSISA